MLITAARHKQKHNTYYFSKGLFTMLMVMLVQFTVHATCLVQCDNEMQKLFKSHSKTTSMNHDHSMMDHKPPSHHHHSNSYQSDLGDYSRCSCCFTCGSLDILTYENHTRLNVADGFDTINFFADHQTIRALLAATLPPTRGPPANFV